MSFDENPADEDPHGECRYEIQRLGEEVTRLINAIRKHRDQRGDDRCWMDDEDLYRVLPEGYAPPARDSAVELTNCERFILNRRNPETVYISPEIAICTLRSNLSSAVGLAIEALNKSCTDIGHWIQLAERQFAELPNAIYNPLAPTRAGIEASHAVRKIIGNAIESLRTLESAEAT